ncbi:mobilization protein [Campylobacter upsaliensis]|uniref:mobilization protein n=1 Tax=Campylobacter upsaliensis TaxID=28080 RepID=UPI002B3A314E|nr:mobilization protein [Campylobacter upsaliensis]MEB2819696.1 mobilization protein [Campylobacter upsaliensis]
MAKKGTAHYSKKTPQLEHNDRTKDEAKTIHKELSHLNEYTCTSQEVQTKIDELYSKAQNNFYEYCKNKNGLAKSGKPKGLHNFTKKEKCYHEFIYEINENTTMEQCKELSEKIAELTGFTPLQISIHRDEGHNNKNGDFITHYHAHATFFTLERETGLQLARMEASLTKENLSKIQDLTAQTLQMERGERRFERGEKKNYIQDYKEYARVKEQEREILDIALETQETALKLKNDLDLREIDLKLKENDLNAKETHLNEERQKIESGYPEAFNDLEKKRNQEKKGLWSYFKNIITGGKHFQSIDEKYNIAKNAIIAQQKRNEAELIQKDKEIKKTKNEAIEAKAEMRTELSEKESLLRELDYENMLLTKENKALNNFIAKAEQEALKKLDFNAEIEYLRSNSTFRTGLSELEKNALNNELTRRQKQDKGFTLSL